MGFLAFCGLYFSYLAVFFLLLIWVSCSGKWLGPGRLNIDRLLVRCARHSRSAERKAIIGRGHREGKGLKVRQTTLTQHETRMRNVSFRYVAGELLVLRNCSLHIGAGKTLATAYTGKSAFIDCMTTISGLEIDRCSSDFCSLQTRSRS